MKSSQLITRHFFDGGRLNLIFLLGTNQIGDCHDLSFLQAQPIKRRVASHAIHHSTASRRVTGQGTLHGSCMSEAR